MEDPKRCKCGSVDIAASNLRCQKYICKSCDAAKARKWWAANKQRGSERRLAHKRGCTVDDVLRCRQNRCVICNVPPWILKRYRLGPMNIGHLVPGDASGGFEPMCKKCNRYLGARRLTEQTGREVLRRSRRYWSQIQMRDEAWMHTDVDGRGYGFGGISETPGRQRTLDKLAEERNGGNTSEGESGRTDLGGDGLPT